MRLPNPFAPSRLEQTLRQIAADVAHVLRHQHELKEALVVTKDELKTQIADVKTVLTEARKDVNRVADRLDQAVANNDLSDVSAAVQELRELAQGIGDRAEQSDPEQPAQPEQPVVTEPVGPAGPQSPNNLQV